MKVHKTFILKEVFFFFTRIVESLYYLLFLNLSGKNKSKVGLITSKTLPRQLQNKGKITLQTLKKEVVGSTLFLQKIYFETQR